MSEPYGSSSGPASLPPPVTTEQQPMIMTPPKRITDVGLQHVTPAKPYNMSRFNEITRKTPIGQMEKMVWALARSFELPPKTVQLFPGVLSWKDAAEKKKYLTLMREDEGPNTEWNYPYSFSKFVNESSFGVDVKIGFFIASTESKRNPTKAELRNELFHGFVTILILSTKTVLFWDSNAWAEDREEVAKLYKPQRNLLDMIEERGRVATGGVWIAGEGNDEEGKCLRLTFEALVELMKEDWTDVSENTLRKRGFLKLKR